MAENSKNLRAINLEGEQATLLDLARSLRARRAMRTLYGSRDSVLKQTMLAVLCGRQLAENESPGEATLHLLSGRVRLNARGRVWDLSRGDLIAIPSERHSVTALVDSVFVISVADPSTDASPTS